jgi:hypothetical protein
MNRRTRYFLAILTAAAVLVLASVAQAGMAVRHGRDIAPTCMRDATRWSACQLVNSFFDALNAGRPHQACSLLGVKLRGGAGGASCPEVLAMSQGTPFEIIDARTSQSGVEVRVDVGLRELDHWRILQWNALVGREAGQLKLLDTTLNKILDTTLKA